jgi:predicted GIY-YIG superfamily endonuclease
MYTVYSLIDPRTSLTHYVGITEDVFSRMRQHSRGEGNNVAKNAWIQELQREQLMFIMHSLEKVDTLEQALEREKFWIRHYLDKGEPLTNIASVISSSSPDPRVPRYTSEQVHNLHFKTQAGYVISVFHATSQEFNAFIKQYIHVEAEGNTWPFMYRKHAINLALKQGIQPLFCEAPGGAVKPPHPWVIAEQSWYTDDGRIVNVEHATDAEFQQFIESADIQVKNKGNREWPFEERCRIISYAMIRNWALPFIEQTREAK